MCILGNEPLSTGISIFSSAARKRVNPRDVFNPFKYLQERERERRGDRERLIFLDVSEHQPSA